MQQLRRAQEPVSPIGTMQAGCMCVRASIVFKIMSLAAVAGVLLAAGAAEAEPASIDTGIGIRDKHLRSADFLDVARFPTVTFESRRVEVVGRRATVTGKLTLHGVTREIVVPVDVRFSEGALVATGGFQLNRRDYGIIYSSFLNPIGNAVHVTFTFRARAS